MEHIETWDHKIVERNPAIDESIRKNNEMWIRYIEKCNRERYERYKKLIEESEKVR